MSEEDYAKYRVGEASANAQREYDRLALFAEGRGVHLDDAGRGCIVRLIQEAQAYTRAYYFGPYDGLPTPRWGAADVVQGLQQEATTIAQAANGISQLGEQFEMPLDCRSLLDAYYSAAIDEKQKEADFFRPESVAARRRQHEALMEAKERELSSPQNSQSRRGP